MLQKVMRHGFEFWEAPRNTGPVFEDVDPEYQMQRERMRLRRAKLEELVKIVTVMLGASAEGAVEGRKLSGCQVGEDGARGGPRQAGTRPTKYGKRKENPSDPKIWGDLVQFSDEEPIATLAQFGIPQDKETIARRGKGEPKIAEIQERVMLAFGVGREKFFGDRDNGEADVARLVSMALCRAFTNRTTREIGKAHARNHPAVSHAVKRVAALRAADQDFDRKVAQAEAMMVSMQLAA